MSTKQFPVAATIIEQGNKNLGEFIGLVFGPGLVLTDQGDKLGVDTAPAPVVLGGYNAIIDLSVNAARVDMGWKDNLGNPTVVLRTGSRTNTAGAFNGGGVGNKSILGARNLLHGKPIAVG